MIGGARALFPEEIRFAYELSLLIILTQPEP
jgi:hypothetical protein